VRLLAILTLASAKMFLRQREAILWTLILPLFLIGLFSLIKFDGTGSLDIGIVGPHSPDADSIRSALARIEAVTLHAGSAEEEIERLRQGERDLVIVLPINLRMEDSVVVLADPEAKPSETQLGQLILRTALDEMVLARLEGAGRPRLMVQPIVTRHLTYIDFLIPGVISMSIMQMGIFGVAFGFVSLKKRGILRRLSVTPLRAMDFIVAQVVTRMTVLILQMGLMLGVGVLFLDLHFVGDFLSLVVLAILGAVVFLSIGFALAGFSRSEDQVAPIANLISVPMILLSGVFVSRTHLPWPVYALTEIFPLTYLTDGMRAVAIDGASLLGVWPQVLGLVVWSAIAIVLAARLFRWE
jgi:ABC-2 type transport system permease protein